MGWLRRAIFGNLLLKLSALVCAGVLWVYVDGFVPADRVLISGVVFVAGDGLWANVRGSDGTLTGEPFATVEVTVRGPSRVVRLLGPDCVRGEAEVRVYEGCVEGKIVSRVGTCRLTAGDFSLPARGLAVVAVEPEEFTCSVEEGVPPLPSVSP